MMSDDERDAILAKLDAMAEPLTAGADAKAAVWIAESTGRYAITFGGRLFVVDRATRDRIHVKDRDGADLFMNKATGRLITIPWA
jgi:hypothetical protein